jgi:hypothetical protein
MTRPKTATIAILIAVSTAFEACDAHRATQGGATAASAAAPSSGEAFSCKPLADPAPRYYRSMGGFRILRDEVTARQGGVATRGTLAFGRDPRGMSVIGAGSLGSGGKPDGATDAMEDAVPADWHSDITLAFKRDASAPDGVFTPDQGKDQAWAADMFRALFDITGRLRAAMPSTLRVGDRADDLAQVIAGIMSVPDSPGDFACTPKSAAAGGSTKVTLSKIAPGGATFAFDTSVVCRELQDGGPPNKEFAAKGRGEVDDACELVLLQMGNERMGFRVRGLSP